MISRSAVYSPARAAATSLCALASKITLSESDEMMMFRLALKTTICARKTPGLYDRNFLLGAYAENIAMEKLRKAAQSTGNDMNIEFSPILDGEETRSYRFQKGNNGNIWVIDKKTKQYTTELDGLVVVEDIPHVVEIKMGKYTHDAYTPAGTLTRIVRCPHSLKALPPVLEYFKEHRGYDYVPLGVIIGLPHDSFEAITPKVEKRFRKAGGNFLVHSRTLQGKHDLVARLAKEEDIQLVA
jgi:hypothetical protein